MNAQKHLSRVTFDKWSPTFKNAHTGAAEGYKISCNHPILQFELDSIEGLAFLVVQFGTETKPSNNGAVLAVDIQRKSIVWQKPMKLSNDRFFLARSVAIIQSVGVATAFRSANGSELWQNYYYLQTISSNGEYCFFSDKKEAHNIKKIHTQTGALIWSFNRDKGAIGDLEKAVLYGDSLLVISAQGLSYVRLATGKGWSIKANTGTSSSSKTSNYTGAYVGGAIAAGVIGGLLLGSIFIAVPISGQSRTGHSQDNFVVTDSYVFMASYNKLYKMSHVGQILLEIDLPFATVSTPKVFERQGVIHVVSNGKGYDPNAGTVYSTAFAATIRPASYGWEQIFRISEANRDFVNDFYVSDSSITFACASRILELHLVSLDKSREKSYAAKNINVGLKDIVEGVGYIESEEGYVSTSDLMPGHIFIENTSKMKIEIDRNFELASVITRANFFTLIDSFNDLKLISNGFITQLIDEKHQLVFDFQFSNRTQFIGNNLVDIKENEVFWVALDDY